MHPANFRLTRQEHQDTARLVSDGLQHRIDHPRLDELARLERPAPPHIDRVHAPFAADHRGIVEQARQTLALKGRRHQQDLQRRLVTQQLATIEAQGQGQVGIEAALVELVEDQQAHTVQGRVGLQTTGENPFGNHLDPRVRADLAVQPNAITDRLPDLLAQLAGQPLGCRPCRQAPRFEHEDALPGQPRLIKQRQRHTGGLAGAGGRFEHRFVAQAQGCAQGWQYGIDR
ncbi:hypothetical protein D3C81_785550 [compost metagenome]